MFDHLALVTRDLLIDEEKAHKHKVLPYLHLPAWFYDKPCESVKLEIKPLFLLPLAFPNKIRIAISKTIGLNNIQITRVQIDSLEVDEALQIDIYPLYYATPLDQQQLHKQTEFFNDTETVNKLSHLQQKLELRPEIFGDSPISGNWWSDIPQQTFLSLYVYLTPIGQQPIDLGFLNSTGKPSSLIKTLVDQLIDLTLTFAYNNFQQLIELHHNDLGTLTIRLEKTHHEEKDLDRLHEVFEQFAIGIPSRM